GLRQMSDEKLARVAAKGFSEERIFQKTSVYTLGGNIVSLPGDRAILLNPVLSPLDPAATFRDAIFNPSNPSTVVDRGGSSLVRYVHSLINVSFEHIRLSGSSGPSFGSIFIRGLDLGGTTVIFTYRK
ncbi:MAG TPA: hypothetical protein VHK70_02290, partial [Burkholderiaceae bacterium]|nr:hypothetical protein [Burkholderiaceae bacterium]